MSEGVNNDEEHMSTPELIRLHGYPAETHHVWTEDGYRLELHRVPYPLNKSTPAVTCDPESCSLVVPKEPPETIISITELPESPAITSLPEPSENPIVRPSPREEVTPNSRPPVLVQHGLLSSSADWVLLGPQKAFAYALCDSGFDVWLGNARGNAYSQYHKHYSLKDKGFWEFSWHEMGYYDLPATIDYILETTGHSSLYYVGYSQGTTSFFVMASERPEYNAKVKTMISMAPIAFLSNQRSPLLKCAVPFNSLMEWGSAYCNIHQWFPRNRLQARALGTLIRNAPSTLTKGVCTSWLYLVAGFGSNQLDKSMLPLIFGHFPAGSSARQMMHYSQSVLCGSFRQFDHGKKKNMELYGSPNPPKYNLNKVKVPVTIFYSENDFLTDPSDVQRLADNLPNVLGKHKIEYCKFNHIDYLWGVDAKTLVYNKVIKLLKLL